MRILSAMIIVLLASTSSWAKPPPNILKAVLGAYPPAEEHRGLVSAYVPLDLSKVKGHVVAQKGGIPVERAKYFISWDDYDYRGAIIRVGGTEAITTRRGSPYAYLKKGDVMAVSGIKDFGGTIYVKLISPEVYIPDERALDKRFSRVTVMLGFKFPREVFEMDDADTVLKKMAEWIRPFPSLDEATKASQAPQAR